MRLINQKSLEAFRWNMRTVLEQGRLPCFVTITYWSWQPWWVVSEHTTRFIRNVWRQNGSWGVRVPERHASGRPHAHVLTDRWWHYDVIEAAQHNTIVGWVDCQPCWGGDMAGYLEKEMRKQWRRDDGAQVRWRTFGKFPDVTRTSDITIDSPWHQAFRDAWCMREKGQGPEEVFRMAVHMFRQYVGADPESQAFDECAEYFENQAKGGE